MRKRINGKWKSTEQELVLKQEQIWEYISESSNQTAYSIAQKLRIDREYVRQYLKWLEADNLIRLVQDDKCKRPRLVIKLVKLYG